MELFHAHQQWATRPDDQRFSSLPALYEACKAYADTARERANVRLDSLRVENIDGDVQLVGRGGVPAKLTHWAFGQVCARVGAPASYLRELPATLAAQNLNHGLARRLRDAGQDATVNMLFHLNDGFLLRALTSDKYERIWNWEVAERLLEMQTRGWDVARPTINQGRDPQGERLPLYASDHDMFAFVCSNECRISEPGNPDGLRRGLIVANSEVGASTLQVLRFLFREMCGNHIIWGAESVTELKLRHVGTIRDRLQAWDASIQQYLDSSARDDEAIIQAAQRKRIAGTKDEVLDAIFGKRIPGLTRKAIEAGYDAVQDVDGDPRSVWGMVQGLTRHSQTIPYADQRVEIDRAAGRLLTAF